jgi:uncharacterized protein YodC (DUF2158 family)
MNFKIGDVVILKSGGPPMTVHKIAVYPATDPDQGLLCVWFDGNHKLEAIFHPNAVEPSATSY